MATRAAGFVPLPWNDPAVKRGDFASPTVKRWRQDIDTIGNALTALQSSRQVYSELGRVIASNERLQTGNLLLERMLRWYVDHVLLAIRRDADPDTRTVSLRCLLDEIEQNPQELTLSRFRLLYTGSERPPSGDDIFATMMLATVYRPLADASGEALDPLKVRSDIDALTLATKRIKSVANQTVAHRQRAKLGGGALAIRVKDVHDAIDAVESIVKKYMAFLTGVSFSTFAPVDQTDWPEIFTFAWRPRLPRN
jgi:hypothetical protein